MARAREDVLVRMKKYRTAVVGAEPAKRNVRIFGRAKEKAGPIVFGIRKHFRAADGNFTGVRDESHGILLAAPTDNQGHEGRARCGDADNA